jgi:hypothetical protein
MSRLVRICVLSLIAAGCDHASPFDEGPLGAIGPRTPGPEARLDLTDRSASWTEDGKGFLYTRTCFGRSPPLGGSPIASIVLRPAHGGSATWELCEGVNSFRTERDSAAEFSAPALGADGRLLYVECVWPGISDLTCTNAGHMTLWLGDSARNFSRRRKIRDLYHAGPGLPPDPPNVVNHLTAITWVGPDAFIGIGANLNAFAGDRTLGVVYGTTGVSPSLELLPGTSGVAISSAAESNRTLVFSRDSQNIERMPIRGGTATHVAVVPLFIDRRIVALSCRAEFCLVLTTEGGSGGDARSTFWSLSLNSGLIAPLRTVSGAASSARLSPSSNAVLVARADALYLFTDLLPQ